MLFKGRERDSPDNSWRLSFQSYLPPLALARQILRAASTSATTPALRATVTNDVDRVVVRLNEVAPAEGQPRAALISPFTEATSHWRSPSRGSSHRWRERRASAGPWSMLGSKAQVSLARPCAGDLAHRQEEILAGLEGKGQVTLRAPADCIRRKRDLRLDPEDARCRRRTEPGEIGTVVAIERLEATLSAERAPVFEEPRPSASTTVNADHALHWRFRTAPRRAWRSVATRPPPMVEVRPDIGPQNGVRRPFCRQSAVQSRPCAARLNRHRHVVGVDLQHCGPFWTYQGRPCWRGVTGM